MAISIAVSAFLLTLHVYHLRHCTLVAGQNAMTTPGQQDTGNATQMPCHELCQPQPPADEVLKVVLGSDPSSSTSSRVLQPFHTVCSKGRAAALRTISHLHLDRAAEWGVPPERQLCVLAAADHATALTLHSSQIGGLVACLVQQLEQQQQEKELLQEGVLQLSLGNATGAADVTLLTTITTSSSGYGSSLHPTRPLHISTSNLSSSSYIADAAALYPSTPTTPTTPWTPAAKPAGPCLRLLTVMGPVTAATIQHLQQLLDLLPGTQHLEEVVLSNGPKSAIRHHYYQSLWLCLTQHMPVCLALMVVNAAALQHQWSLISNQGSSSSWRSSVGGSSSCRSSTGGSSNSWRGSSGGHNWRSSCGGGGSSNSWCSSTGGAGSGSWRGSTGGTTSSSSFRSSTGGASSSFRSSSGGGSSSWRNSCHALAVEQWCGDREHTAATQLPLSHLQPLLGSVRHLRTLFLAGVSAAGLAQHASSLRQLRKLHVTGIGASGGEVLAAAAELKELRHLGMVGPGSALTTWTESLNDLVHLSSLDLSCRRLTEEALEGVCSMTGLIHLNLAGSEGFTILPGSISNLVRLKDLWLQGSLMGDSPECLTTLPSLGVLGVGHLGAAAPLQLEVVWRLKHLIFLHIEDDHMTAVPDAISKLSSLGALRVMGQSLVALPTTVSKLVRLNSLRLFAPQLRVLPEGITALNRLGEVVATGVVLREQSPAVQAFLAGRQAQGCSLKLARSGTV